MNNKKFIVILAGGKGTRINAKDIPKNMYPINGKPMIGYFVDKIKDINPQKTVIVVGFRGENIVDYLKKYNYSFVWQKKRLGTGHATLQAKKELINFDGITFVVNGDNPFFQVNTYLGLSKKLVSEQAVMGLVSVKLDPKFSYGRLDIDGTGHVRRIIEVKNAVAGELKIKEMNAGLYAFDNKWLWKNINKLEKNKLTGEYYITDLVEIANRQNEKIIAYEIINPQEAIGINTKEHLELAQKIKV